MIKIALITEGITDQFIIKPIVENYFKDKEFKFNPIQPQQDETEKQKGFGGWVNVLEWCKGEDIEEVVIYNDFVIIQIDADVSQNEGFDIPHLDSGKEKEASVLCNDIINKLQSLISQEIWDKYKNKFLFAIGILEIECWLLPLIETKLSTKNCLDRLNKGLRKKDENVISKNKNSYNSRQVYKSLSGKFRNKKIIDKYAIKNAGFIHFVGQFKLLS